MFHCIIICLFTEWCNGCLKENYRNAGVLSAANALVFSHLGQIIASMESEGFEELVSDGGSQRGVRGREGVGRVRESEGSPMEGGGRESEGGRGEGGGGSPREGGGGSQREGGGGSQRGVRGREGEGLRGESEGGWGEGGDGAKE